MTHTSVRGKNCLCVGIDLHKDTLTVAVLDPITGEATFGKFACKCRNQIVEFFIDLRERGPHIVAIEAVGFYRWLWDLLEPVVERLVLADATQCRALAGRRIKTDREDALNVAELQAAGRLPVAWAPPAEVAALRDVTRHRHYLSRQHARVLHRVKSIMNQLNRPGPARMKAPALLRYIQTQRDLLPMHLIDQLEMAADELVLLERQIDRIDRRLRQTLGEAIHADAAHRLTSFPGVGVVIAATVLAEVGDFGRFDHPKAVARYAGLDPRVFASADSVRVGRIAKCGSADLRWAMVQAAWTAVRCDESVRRIWLRIARRGGRKCAIVAVARLMLNWMWCAHRDGRDYRQAA